MSIKTKFTSTFAACLLLGSAAANAAPIELFGSTTDSLLRGSFAGDYPGEFFGGNFPGVFPIVLNEATARASVLGGPDGAFLSLPGGPGSPGTAFAGAYVEIGFGMDFQADAVLKIWEAGDSAESAQLFIWANNGGNLQLNVTTTATGVISVDLAPYAWVLSALGATAFTKVGIGGLDQLGASAGFDLDAVSITVPEPTSLALLALGVFAVGFVRRRSIRR
jgi:hypothetical protein